MPITEFSVEHNGETIPILDASVDAKSMDDYAGDEKRLEWMDRRSVNEAVWEKGIKCFQTTGCKLRYQFTLDDLTEHSDVGKT